MKRLKSHKLRVSTINATIEMRVDVLDQRINRRVVLYLFFYERLRMITKCVAEAHLPIAKSIPQSLLILELDLLQVWLFKFGLDID